jgi:hypothetical protein
MTGMTAKRIVIVGGIVGGLWYLYKSHRDHMGMIHTSTIDGCLGGCQGSIVSEPRDTAYPLTGNLYPLRHPLFCAREAAKHCTLLEDHLSDPHRDCKECERKHFLMAEGFLEEGLLMDRHHKYHDIIVPQLEKFRECIKEFNSDVEGHVIAQHIREIRKPLSDHGFKYFS